jgi:uncharacterized protein with GYD domain
MPTYIMLTKLTDEGRKTVKDNPARIKEVNKEVEKMGIKITGQYALLGIYDFLNVFEAPDNESVAKMAMELGARGTIETMTMPAMTLDKFVTSMSKKAVATAV